MNHKYQRIWLYLAIFFVVLHVQMCSKLIEHNDLYATQVHKSNKKSQPQNQKQNYQHKKHIRYHHYHSQNDEVESHQENQAYNLSGENTNSYNIEKQQKVSPHPNQNEFSQRRLLQILPNTQDTQQTLQNLENFSTLPGQALQPVKQKQIISREFSGIGLYEQVPQIFVIGQIYRFHGVVLNPTNFRISRQQYVNIVFIQAGTGSEFRCFTTLELYETNFEISCRIQKRGKYFLSIFTGSNGRTSNKQRYIATESQLDILIGSNRIDKDAQPPKPEGLRLDVINNDLIIKWDSKAPISRLTVSQNLQNEKKQMVYKLSNYHQQFSIQYGEYFNFKQIITSISLSHASSQDNSYFSRNSDFSDSINTQFNATRHQFSRYKQPLISQISQIPYKLRRNHKMKVYGRFNEDIRKQVYILTPSFQIIKYNVGNSNPRDFYVSRGNLIEFELNLTENGAYILQINTHYGQAVVNRPIYVGQDYPLLPDFEDLKRYAFRNNMEFQPFLQQYIIQDFKPVTKKMDIELTQLNQPSPDSSLLEMRQFLLQLTNLLRMKYNLGDLYLDDHLNNISQAHAQDMLDRNYFAHYSPEGEGPGDRALKANFNYKLGQNLASSPTLIEAHLSLQRSAVHLQNSIKPYWRRVGVGIVRNGTNYIVVYKYSIQDIQLNPPTQNELNAQKQLVSDYMRIVNPQLQPENEQFSEGIQEWMKTDQSIGLFNYLSRRGFRFSMQWIVLEIDYTPNLLQTLQNNPQLTVNPSSFTRYGIGLILNDENKIEIYVVFY